jgi:hypothetical protein
MSEITRIAGELLAETTGSYVSSHVMTIATPRSANRKLEAFHLTALARNLHCNIKRIIEGKGDIIFEMCVETDGK